jgi:hypothetical protein
VLLAPLAVLTPPEGTHQFSLEFLFTFPVTYQGDWKTYEKFVGRAWLSSPRQRYQLCNATRRLKLGRDPYTSEFLGLGLDV